MKIETLIKLMKVTERESWKPMMAAVVCKYCGEILYSLPSNYQPHADDCPVVTLTAELAAEIERLVDMDFVRYKKYFNDQIVQINGVYRPQSAEKRGRR